MIKTLLELNADMNQPTDDGAVPLGIACACGQIAALEAPMEFLTLIPT